MGVAHYTDTPLIANYLKRSLSADEEAALAVILPAVDKYIENATNSKFFEETGYTTRYYPGGSRIIDIEPCTDIQSVSTVQDDGTISYAYIQTSEWVARPENDTVKTEIALRYYHYPEGEHRIAVNAKFSGYDGGIPADIQMCATLLAVDYLKLSSVGTSTAEREEIEGYRVTNQAPATTIAGLAAANPLIQSTLMGYREILL